jgi:hypothetical protein
MYTSGGIATSSDKWEGSADLEVEILAALK